MLVRAGMERLFWVCYMEHPGTEGPHRLLNSGNSTTKLATTVQKHKYLLKLTGGSKVFWGASRPLCWSGEGAASANWPPDTLTAGSPRLPADHAMDACSHGGSPGPLQTKENPS